MPKIHGMLGLPAKAHLAAAARAQRHAVEPLLRVKSTDGGLADAACLQPSVGDERTQDERDRSARVLAANVDQELARCGRQVAAASLVGASGRAQGVDAAFLVRVIPTSQGRARVAFGRMRSRWAETFFGELAERGSQLAVIELANAQSPDDLSTK